MGHFGFQLCKNPPKPLSALSDTPPAPKRDGKDTWASLTMGLKASF
ncbi:hypothetical protein HAL013_06980 [Helicobacter ailurogastricus]|uniref:Uncharacterized protein n=1 Tax=Helicobacter ailurogastricus TaxID=1578720 RepID=A0A0K2X4Q9_9HELI|nr:hypothetical protein HAL011_07190 [Helicobacter ailurogastricus]CRF42510.1 hypothetical protein HAL013_06980 [Helicobacter ailurogastricus]CRF44184.1 hypothetical protein HAL09_07570 [Helicobacter ailurogastricus]